MIIFRPTAKHDKQSTIIIIDKMMIDKKELFVRRAGLRNEILKICRSGKFEGGKGEIFPLIFQDRLILLAGIGNANEISPTDLRIALRRVLLSPFLAKITDIEIIPHEKTDEVIRAIIEAFLIGIYSWKKYVTKDKNAKIADIKNIWIAVAPKQSYIDTIAVCSGVNFTRDLVNDNADTVNSAFIEKVVRAVAKGKRNISVSVLNEKELKAKGLNLHLAVNQGSRNEPKLIIVKYSGLGKDKNYTAIIGKGITFDTGGLNLKPTGHLETMRTDMSGAAAVIGTLKNAIALSVRKNILFVVALAENAIGSGAYKPGDVIRSYSGKTVEIGNTDAEGRLVLADAIAYIAKNYRPSVILDIATLTGACVIALGHDYSGLMSNDETIATKLLRSADDTGDRAWRLPVYPELKEHVKSKIADIKNIGLPKGAAGASSAAEFLRQFAGDAKWAHLDIAGTAFATDEGRLYFGYGATGAGVRLMTDYLRKN